MREIKFRAWYGNKMHDNAEAMRLLYNYSIGSTLTAKSELMQFTGLFDKNGKEIYEGDVLPIEDSYTERMDYAMSGPREDFKHIVVVVYNEASAAFGVSITERGDYYEKGFASFENILGTTGQVEFEVIGTQFENPELLTK